MTLTPKQREALKLKYGGRCAYCGSVLGAKWQADHLLPLRREGTWVRKKGGRGFEYQSLGTMLHPERDTLDNLMPACIPCNNNKADLPLEQWRKSLEHLPEVLEKNYSAWRHANRFGLVLLGRVQVKFHFETYTVRRRFTP